MQVGAAVEFVEGFADAVRHGAVDRVALGWAVDRDDHQTVVVLDENFWVHGVGAFGWGRSLRFLVLRLKRPQSSRPQSSGWRSD